MCSSAGARPPTLWLYALLELVFALATCGLSLNGLGDNGEVYRLSGLASSLYFLVRSAALRRCSFISKSAISSDVAARWNSIDGLNPCRGIRARTNRYRMISPIRGFAVLSVHSEI